MPFKLKRASIDVALVCSDFSDSLRFYRDQLGFEQVMEIEIPARVAQDACLAPRAFRQVRLRSGEALIKLMEIESPPVPRSHDFQAGIRWLTLIVDDVSGLYARLSERGVEFMSEPIRPPDAVFIVCAKAPDGLLIEFVQPFEEDV